MQNTRCNLKSCLASTDTKEFPLALTRVEQAPKSPLLKRECSAYISQVEKKIIPPASFLLPSIPREKGGQVQSVGHMLMMGASWDLSYQMMV